MDNPNLPPPSDDTLKFKRAHVYAALLPLAFVAGLALGYVFWGRSPAQAAPAPTQAVAEAQEEAPQRQYKRYDVPVDDDYVYGDPAAPITIIEFSDFQCPFCKRWYQDTWLSLRKDYTGKVKFVYRDFPLYSIHSEAEPAALAANCAGEQGKYYEYHDLLMSSNDMGAAVYEQFASQLGLNLEQFKECVQTEKYKDEITADYQYAVNFGINSTPTFFINGIPLVGAQPYSAFKDLIDKELAGEIPQ